jgi:hypothetical protein
MHGTGINPVYKTVPCARAVSSAHTVFQNNNTRRTFAYAFNVASALLNFDNEYSLSIVSDARIQLQNMFPNEPDQITEVWCCGSKTNTTFIVNVSFILKHTYFMTI